MSPQGCKYCQCLTFFSFCCCSSHHRTMASQSCVAEPARNGSIFLVMIKQIFKTDGRNGIGNTKTSPVGNVGFGKLSAADIININPVLAKIPIYHCVSLRLRMRLRATAHTTHISILISPVRTSNLQMGMLASRRTIRILLPRAIHNHRRCRIRESHLRLRKALAIPPPSLLPSLIMIRKIFPSPPLLLRLSHATRRIIRLRLLHRVTGSLPQVVNPNTRSNIIRTLPPTAMVRYYILTRGYAACFLLCENRLTLNNSSQRSMAGQEAPPIAQGILPRLRTLVILVQQFPSGHTPTLRSFRSGNSKANNLCASDTIMDMLHQRTITLNIIRRHTKRLALNYLQATGK